MTYSPLTVTLLGLGITFLGLVLLIFISKLMSALIGAKADTVNESEDTAAIPAPAEIVPAVQVPVANKGELVAAISAAIATQMGTDVQGLRILSIKKI